jgi:DNA-binding LytR/AlgR family response regulator
MESMKILIVEDNFLTAETIKMYLSNAGHEIVDTAENFNQAINYILKYSPDIILMDIELGDSSLGGIDILNEINLDIPVIFLSGKTDKETFVKASLKNPAAFLSKPFKEEDLVFQVQILAKKISDSRSISSQPSSFFVYNRESYIRIDKKEVVYLEAKKVYTLIYIKNRTEPVMVSMNLGYLEQHFKDSNFNRITNSVIINEDYLIEIKNTLLIFEGVDKPIEISDSKRAELKKKLSILKSPRPKS